MIDGYVDVTIDEHADRIAAFMNSSSVCPTHDEMLDGEVKAWSAYWSKYNGGNSPKWELDRLMDIAASAGAGLKKHIEGCSNCRPKAK